MGQSGGPTGGHWNGRRHRSPRQVGKQGEDKVRDKAGDTAGTMWEYVGDKLEGIVRDKEVMPKREKGGRDNGGVIVERRKAQKPQTSWHKAGDTAGDKVRGGAGDKVEDELGDKVRDRAGDTLGDKLGDKVEDKSGRRAGRQRGALETREAIEGGQWQTSGKQGGKQSGDKGGDQARDKVKLVKLGTRCETKRETS